MALTGGSEQGRSRTAERLSGLAAFAEEAPVRNEIAPAPPAREQAPVRGPERAPALLAPVPDAPRVRPVERAAVIQIPMTEQALARAAEEAAERAARLAERERALAERERELAEQRRVLAEEYRLLRNQRVHTATLQTGAAGMRAGGRVEPAAPRYAVGRSDGLRGWLRRLFTGASHRTVGGN